MEYRVVIAGGIGSGKSKVTEFLRQSGAKVLVADELNAELLKSPDYISQVAAYFPEAVNEYGIDKDILGRIIYGDENKRQMLMSLAHPLIYRELAFRAQGKPLVFFEIPIYPISGLVYNEMWLVKANAEDRVQRVIARSGYTESRVRKIIALQGDIPENGSITIIDNYGSLEDLRQKTLEKYSILKRKLGLQ